MSIATLNQFFSKHGRFAVILLVLLMVVPLVFLYGVEGCRDVVGGRSGAVAKIEGKPVTFVEFQRERRMVAFSAGNQMRGDREMAEATMIRILLKRKAAEWGIDMVTDEQVKDVIKSIPSFQTDEKFDAKKYKDYLENVLRPQGRSVVFLEQVLRDDIIISRVRERLAGTVTVSDLETFVNFQHGGIRYKGQVARYAASKYNSEVNVTDDDVKAYFEENKDEYRVDKQLKAKVVHFSALKMSQTLDQPTTEELQQAYQENYATQTEISHILKRRKTPANRAALEKLIKELQDGADFAELAKAHSEDTRTKDKAGSLGWMGGDRMPEGFGEAIAELSEGDVAPKVVETQQGLHVIKRGGEQKNPQSFEILRDSIALALRQERDEVAAREQWQTDPQYAKPQVKGSQILLEVALFESNDILAKQKAKAEELASKIRTQPTQFSKLARENSDDQSTKTKGGDLGWFAKGSQPEAVDKAFLEMAVGEVKVVQGKRGVYVLLKTDARERTPFASVKARLQAQMRSARIRDAAAIAEEKAGAFLVAVKAAWNQEDPEADAATALAGVAEASGYKLHETEWFSSLDTRLTGVPGNTITLAQKAKALTMEEPLTEVVSTANDFYVAVLAETKDGFLPEVMEPVPNPAAKEGDVPKMRLTATGRQARMALLNKLATAKAVEAAKADREKVAAALAAGKSFKEASDGVDFQETDEFMPRFGPPGANAKEIADAAKEMSKGDLSEVIEATNGAVLFYLEETKLPSVDDFDERQASYAMFFEQRRAQEATVKALKKLQEEANITYGGVLQFMNEPEKNNLPGGANAG